MGERLRPPLKRDLVPPDATASLARVRARLETRIAAPSPKNRAARLLAMGACAAAVLVLGVAIGRATVPAAPTARPEPRAVIVTGTGEVRHALGDGTTIDLGPRTELRNVATQPDLEAYQLVRGAGRFVIAKRPTRSFRVTAGDVSVAVRGTIFVIEHDETTTRIHVDEGAVEVTSPAGVRLLEAGAEITLPEAQPAAAPAAPPSPRADAAPPPRDASSPPLAAAWRPLAVHGDYRSAYETLGAAGLAREAADATDAATLFALADVARLSGHAGEAAAPLSRIVREHRHEPSAALAAFTLGKIKLENLAAPREAASAFEEAIRIGSPPSVVEDATARRVEAYATSGDLAKARAAAAEYRATFPDGRYGAEVGRWASGNP